MEKLRSRNSDVIDFYVVKISSQAEKNIHCDAVYGIWIWSGKETKEKKSKQDWTWVRGLFPIVRTGR